MPLSEEERFPLIDAAGRRLLDRLHEHPHAPRFNHHCGDRLNSAGLKSVQEFAALIEQDQTNRQRNAYPDWLETYLSFCLREVPFYRRYPLASHDFTDLPLTSRVDLSRAPWDFVPDQQNLDDLILYSTSGTTGHPLDILSHPIVSSKYVPLLQSALKTRSVAIEGGSGRVAVIQICYQKRTFTFASLSSYLGNAGNLKLNLNPSDWRDPDDRVKYLDDCDAEIYTGDPISFTELARLPLHSRPKALVSTSMAMLPGLQKQLENRFDCPVLDLYSMNESGPLAVHIDPPATANGSNQRLHQILQPRIYVEILDENSLVCPLNQRGEITITGGFNPFLPLLRYRTGDQASLVELGGTKHLALSGLEGRPPTVFRGTKGQLINNIDVTAVLRRFTLSRFSMHQSADGVLQLRLTHADTQVSDIQHAMINLFGPDQRLSITELDAYDNKVTQYTSDMTQ